MPFVNRIRLPFYLSRPQYPVDEDIYMKANGTRRILKSITTKELQGLTDYLPQNIHEQLVIALRHDIVSIESEKFTGDIRISGAYEIEWIDFLDFPVAQAKFKAFEEAFAARLTRCDICPTGTISLLAVDDEIPTVLQEGETYQYNVASNDSICCSPAVFSITAFDNDIFESISIDNLGVVTFTLKTGLDSVANANLFSYKVECEGQEDTADVYGTVEGTESELCEAPSDLQFNVVGGASFPVQVHAEWTAPAVPPDHYHWLLLRRDGFGYMIVSYGDTTSTSIDINALDCEERYRFYVRAHCTESDDSDFSAYIFQQLDTPDCDSENEPMTIVLGMAKQVDEGNDIWSVQANIVDPAGVELDENITIAGTVEINGISYPFSFTLLATQSSAESAPVGVPVPLPSVAYIINATATPDSATGTDLNEYDLILSI